MPSDDPNSPDSGRTGSPGSGFPNSPAPDAGSPDAESAATPPKGGATVTPVWPSDPPKIGDFWLDGRIAATAAGAGFLAHQDDDTAAIVVQLSRGAAGDKAARDRFSGLINPMHVDDVIARGGHEQEQGRLGRKFRPEDDDPVEPDDAPLAPWVALAYDGTPKAPETAARLLSAVELELPPQGEPSGPDYTHYWATKSQPGLTRVWPLPWPGRYDRAGWVSILVSWLLMLLMAAIAVLIAILLFRNEPPMTPPPPQPSITQTPPPSSSSASPPPSSSSPSPSSASPSPSSASPSPSGSSSPTPSGSPTMSDSASPEPASPTPGESGSPEAGTPTPNSKL